MCNLYSITTNQDAIRRLFAVTRDMTGNLPSMPGVFPDQGAPSRCEAHDGQRELIKMKMGNAFASQIRRAAHHKYPQPVLAPLARLAKTGKPVPYACLKLFRVHASAESCHG